jgi:hypothetical protein
MWQINQRAADEPLPAVGTPRQSLCVPFCVSSGGQQDLIARFSASSASAGGPDACATPPVWPPTESVGAATRPAPSLTQSPPTPTSIGIAATTTFRRDELSFPPALRDRTHRRPDRSTTTRSSPPPPSSLSSLVRHIARSAQPTGRNGQCIGHARTPHRTYPNTSPPPPPTSSSPAPS